MAADSYTLEIGFRLAWHGRLALWLFRQSGRWLRIRWDVDWCVYQLMKTARWRLPGDRWRRALVVRTKR